jgi:hypothetical protein
MIHRPCNKVNQNYLPALEPRVADNTRILRRRLAIPRTIHMVWTGRWAVSTMATTINLDSPIPDFLLLSWSQQKNSWQNRLDQINSLLLCFIIVSHDAFLDGNTSRHQRLDLRHQIRNAKRLRNRVVHAALQRLTNLGAASVGGDSYDRDVAVELAVSF